MAVIIPIYRRPADDYEVVVAEVKPDAGSSQVKRIMGDNTVTLTFTMNYFVAFMINDYAYVFNEEYKLNRMPVVKKNSAYNYEYTLVLQSNQYDLQKAQYMFYDANNELREGDFSLTGTATDFINLLISNINRVSSDWVKGGILITDYKTLSFSKEDCFSALQKIAEAFETEFYVEDKTVHLAKLVIPTIFEFRYGRTKGLYDITRTQIDSMDVFTRLYAFGGDKNLPSDYPSSRLRLPGGYRMLINNLTYVISMVNANLRLITFDWTAPTNGSITGVAIEYRILNTTTWYTMPTGPVNSPVDFYGHYNTLSIIGLYTVSTTGPNTINADGPLGSQLREGDRLVFTQASTGIQGSYTIATITPSGPGFTLTTIETIATMSSRVCQIEIMTPDINVDLEIRFKSMPFGISTPSIIIRSFDTTITDPLFAGSPNQLPYLEKNKDVYGIIEADFIDEDIYPKRDGIVTGVDATDVYEFTDSSMDFDLNSYLVPGVAAKVTFNTGQLSGYTFDIKSYDNGTKTFQILKNKDEKALDIPSSLLKMSIGDKYVLVDIQMPETYVTNAELKLQEKAQAFLDANCAPTYQYTVTCDPADFRKKKIKMSIGNVVRLMDIELDVDKDIRTIGVTRSIIDEYEYTFELGETIQPGTIARILSAQSSNTTDINNIGNSINNNALLNGNYIGDFKVTQGTVIIENIQTGTGTAVLIGSDGKLYKA